MRTAALCLLLCLGAGAGPAAAGAPLGDALASTVPGTCHTAGRVYVQKHAYDMACPLLECARKEDPENVDVLSLLAVARAEQRQYISAGAAFQMGIDAARKKKDEKSLNLLGANRNAFSAKIFNMGMKALNKAGAGAGDGEKTDHAPYEPPPDLQTAITDTLPFPPYSGTSALAEAAYDFELASYVDPSSLETFQNLTYALCQLGRDEEAIRAAEFALRQHPGDARLMRNLDAARRHRENPSAQVTAVRAGLPMAASVTCDSADCALQWQRAQLWLSRHSIWKLEIGPEVVETYRPKQGEPGYGFRVRRRELRAGTYEITIEAACGIAFEECTPPWDEVKSAFLQYLRTGNDVLEGKDLTRSSIR